LAVLVYYLNKLTDIHRDERKEWQEANDKHVDKFADVIADNTKALVEMKGELKENRGKM
jgi:ClpP class serine protease